MQALMVVKSLKSQFKGNDIMFHFTGKDQEADSLNVFLQDHQKYLKNNRHIKI